MLINNIERLHEKHIRQRRIHRLSRMLAALLSPQDSVLDVGCGDGLLSAGIKEKWPHIGIVGIDVLHRGHACIPVKIYDGLNLPYRDNQFDAIMFVDVLHHTRNIKHLLHEAARVAEKSIIIKDHLNNGLLACKTLQFMDVIGNRRYGVGLGCDYWPRKKWLSLFNSMPVSISQWQEKLNLYPWPINLIFDRSLHFLAKLSIKKKPDCVL